MIIHTVWRLWIPLTVLLVVVVGAATVTKLRAVLEPNDLLANEVRDVSEPFVTKDVVYEIFGPTNASGVVNYLDEQAEPQRATFHGLPWRYTISTTLTSIFANVVAQGDANTIGCRITVDGQVRDEQSTSAHGAQAFCLVKSA
ncbi:MmpS family transport accessory protein [Mycobacteroides abscessus]|uniref:MmpS family transport accessory protein n=1 Tax=Mycobacteroides abscessus TaxID=36809 RepID=UPI0019501D0F|nr:MmpS family transport accessory protein [Mycobacteroides abscessus]